MPYFLLLLSCLPGLLLSGCVTNDNLTSLQRSQQSGQTSENTYVALGASDTFGVGTSDPYHENWPTLLNGFLGNHMHLLNLGIPNITLHGALTTELPIALDAHPALVTIWLAVNDLTTNVSIESYGDDLDLLLSRLQDVAPHARIEVGNMPDLTALPYFYSYDPVTLRQQISEFNRVIADVVSQHHAILVDLSNVQANADDISDDGLHPSAVGYMHLAQLFYKALLKQ